MIYLILITSMVLLIYRERRKYYFSRKTAFPYTPAPALLLFLSLIFLIISFLPLYKEVPVPQQEQDLSFVIALDVSRSMLTDDVYPSRLERIKLTLTEGIRGITGPQLALVAFAGTPVLKSPLTRDYSFVVQSLNALSPDSVSRGGSLIGDALRYIHQEVIIDPETTVIILISDGGDQESYPLEASGKLVKQNIPLIAIGIGDPEDDTLLKDQEGAPLLYNNQPVYSRLEEDVLRALGEMAPQNTYIPMRTGDFSFTKLFKDIQEEYKGHREVTTVKKNPLYQIPLGGALLSLIAYALLRLRRRQ